MVTPVNQIWMDGELVPWDAASVHILTHTLHYGFGCFEGIRAYKGPNGSAVFRLDAHVRRLFESTKILGLKLPFSERQIQDACIETLDANGLESGYIRPLVFLDAGAMGLFAENRVRVAVVTWQWGAYLGEEALQKGIRCMVSSFARNHVNAAMAKGKIIGQYTNSILAKREALHHGYDEAIMLDTSGYVSEATGENIFLIRNNIVRTPPMSSAILGGITRQTVIQLCDRLRLDVNRELITRDQLYVADECFLTGTAAEITPVREVDNRSIGVGGRGPVTTRIQDLFFRIVHGEEPEYSHWLTPYTTRAR